MVRSCGDRKENTTPTYLLVTLSMGEELGVVNGVYARGLIVLGERTKAQWLQYAPECVMIYCDTRFIDGVMLLQLSATTLNVSAIQSPTLWKVLPTRVVDAFANEIFQNVIDTLSSISDTFERVDDNSKPFADT